MSGPYDAIDVSNLAFEANRSLQEAEEYLQEDAKPLHNIEVLCEINNDLHDSDEIQALIRAIPRFVFALLEARRVCKMELEFAEEPYHADEHEYALKMIAGALIIGGVEL